MAHRAMDASLIADNLSSPMVLAFAVGALVAAARSELAFPRALTDAISAYLLLAIGWKGGQALQSAAPGEIWLPALATLGLGLVTPVAAYGVTRRLGFGRADAAALAAHYGSVSAVTFAAASTFLIARGTPPEGFMATLLALLEIPGIVVALMLAGRGAQDGRMGEALREVVTGKGIVLLFGGLVIGALASEAGAAQVDPVFRGLFYGALVLFLLDLGLTAARRAQDLRTGGMRLVAFALLAPPVLGTVGVLVGGLSGLDVGGAALLGAMSASASYIAATAAVRAALPQASPAIYLTASLAITFPFNLIVGIPLYAALASALG